MVADRFSSAVPRARLTLTSCSLIPMPGKVRAFPVCRRGARPPEQEGTELGGSHYRYLLLAKSERAQTNPSPSFSNDQRSHWADWNSDPTILQQPVQDYCGQVTSAASHSACWVQVARNEAAGDDGSNKQANKEAAVESGVSSGHQVRRRERERESNQSGGGIVDSEEELTGNPHPKLSHPDHIPPALDRSPPAGAPPGSKRGS